MKKSGHILIIKVFLFLIVNNSNLLQAQEIDSDKQKAVSKEIVKAILDSSANGILNVVKAESLEQVIHRFVIKNLSAEVQDKMWKSIYSEGGEKLSTQITAAFNKTMMRGSGKYDSVANAKSTLKELGRGLAFDITGDVLSEIIPDLVIKAEDPVLEGILKGSLGETINQGFIMAKALTNPNRLNAISDYAVDQTLNAVKIVSDGVDVYRQTKELKEMNLEQEKMLQKSVENTLPIFLRAYARAENGKEKREAEKQIYRTLSLVHKQDVVEDIFNYYIKKQLPKFEKIIREQIAVYKASDKNQDSLSQLRGFLEMYAPESKWDNYFTLSGITNPFSYKLFTSWENTWSNGNNFDSYTETTPDVATQQNQDNANDELANQSDNSPTDPTDPPTTPITVTDPGEIDAALDFVFNEGSSNFFQTFPSISSDENDQPVRFVDDINPNVGSNNVSYRTDSGRIINLSIEGSRSQGGESFYWGTWVEPSNSSTFPRQYWHGGNETTPLILPTVGNARYEGNVNGSYQYLTGQSGDANRVTVTDGLLGNMRMNIDFEQRNGAMNMFNLVSSRGLSIGIPVMQWTLDLDASASGWNSNGINGTLDGSNADYTYSGGMFGSFYGNDYQFFGSSWSAVANANDPNQVNPITSLSGITESERITNDSSQSFVEQVSGSSVVIETPRISQTETIGNINQSANVASNEIDSPVTIDSNSYTSWGTWNSSPSTPERPLKYWIQGQLTPASTIPTQGTATYTGSVIGTYANTGSSSAVGTVTGDVALTADFGQRRIYGQFNNLQGGSINSTVNLDGDFHENASTFSGAITDPGGNISDAGGFAGGFFGANYQAIGGVWSYQNQIHNYNGVFQGTR